MTAHPSAERIATVERALAEIRAGRMVILVDDEDRENEGDLTMAADHCTPEAINFMARHGRGLICLSLTEERVAELGLPMMVTVGGDYRSPRSTAFTVSIDARKGLTTGISAQERAETIRVAVSRDCRPEDLVRPGHIFPVRARRGGVLVRSGHTEGSVDLARLAGREPAGVICEIMRDDGAMARMPDLRVLAEAHRLPIVTIADLIEYRLSQEVLVHRAAEATVAPHAAGISTPLRAYVYTTEVEDTEYLALVLGEPRPDQPTLVRVQTASLLRDVFGVAADPTAEAVTVPLRMIDAEGQGVLLYVFSRRRASLLAELGPGPAGVPAAPAPTAPPPGESRLRDFGLGAQVLADLGCGKIRLITNNPRRVVGASGYGLDIVERVPIRAPGKVLRLREGDGPAKDQAQGKKG
jgi:3,4-dihydroxy 2-butanone 4-phosphate synthase/GTP cyclohydrolase II